METVQKGVRVTGHNYTSRSIQHAGCKVCTLDQVCVHRHVWWKGIKQFLFFFFIQFLNYSLITWNWRAIVLANYWNIAVSDLMFAAANFKILQKVAKAEGNWAWAGYTLGGVVGSLTSTWITKHYLG